MLTRNYSFQGRWDGILLPALKSAQLISGIASLVSSVEICMYFQVKSPNKKQWNNSKWIHSNHSPVLEASSQLSVLFFSSTYDHIGDLYHICHLQDPTFWASLRSPSFTSTVPSLGLNGGGPIYSSILASSGPFRSFGLKLCWRLQSAGNWKKKRCRLQAAWGMWMGLRS